jgi:hypothetical protein
MPVSSLICPNCPAASTIQFRLCAISLAVMRQRPLCRPPLRATRELKPARLAARRGRPAIFHLLYCHSVDVALQDIMQYLETITVYVKYILDCRVWM